MPVRIRRGFRDQDRRRRWRPVDEHAHARFRGCPGGDSLQEGRRAAGFAGIDRRSGHGLHPGRGAAEPGQDRRGGSRRTGARGGRVESWPAWSQGRLSNS